MTTVAGTYVPNHAYPHSEICHSFVYRWLIARGRITGNYPDPLPELNGISGKRILFTPPGMPARTGGIIQALPGNIIGFWDGMTLVHSMVVITPNSWFGANNAGCFGVGTGRTRIMDVNGGFPGAMIRNANMRLGWVGNNNQWRAMAGTLRVTCRNFPVTNYP